MRPFFSSIVNIMNRFTIFPMTDFSLLKLKKVIPYSTSVSCANIPDPD